MPREIVILSPVAPDIRVLLEAGAAVDGSLGLRTLRGGAVHQLCRETPEGNRAVLSLDQPLTVEDLARQAYMSSRHLARHFHAVTGTTPLQWLLTQRIRRAQELLESTDDSVDTIASTAGMGTATTLRRHFHRTIGVPPDAYRRTFRS